MKKDSTTFGLGPEKLANLMRIGSDIGETDSADQVQTKADLLRDWLGATLPLDEVLVTSLPSVLRRFCQELRFLTDETLGSLLLNPETDISAIRKIKDYSKKLTRSAKSEAENDIATCVYYAAIASALVFHKQRITRFSYKNLKDYFSELMENAWLTPDLKRLFERARESCRHEPREEDRETK